MKFMKEKESEKKDGKIVVAPGKKKEVKVPYGLPIIVFCCGSSNKKPFSAPVCSCQRGVNH